MYIYNSTCILRTMLRERFDAASYKQLCGELSASMRSLRLTRDQRAALRCYVNLRTSQGDGCGYQMNRALRDSPHGGPDVPHALQQTISNLDDAIDANRHAIPIRYLFRGVGGKFKTGDVLTMKSFLSTSPLVSRALMYGGVILRLRVNLKLLHWLFSPNEEEVVVARGSRWRVTRVRTDVRPDPNMRHPRDPTNPAHATDVFSARVTLVDLTQVN
jgi:hypothetical protein